MTGDLSRFVAPPAPSGAVLEGAFAWLEPLTAGHAGDLHDAFAADDAIWDYMPVGPFADAAAYGDWVGAMAGGADPFFYAIRNRETGRWCGVASYLRITPAVGTIEIGWITLAPELQRTRAATEALTLMIGWAFDAGYRRVEWKCNAQNRASRRAAERLGFSYEGVFRQATIVKGRNRDTAWFAMIDKEWPALRRAYARWLSPGNFDADGRQVAALSELTAPIRVADDPALAPVSGS